MCTPMNQYSNFSLCALGEISTGPHLESEYYIPDHIFDKINKLTSSMMESGLKQFYDSYYQMAQKYT